MAYITDELTGKLQDILRGLVDDDELTETQLSEFIETTRGNTITEMLSNITQTNEKFGRLNELADDLVKPDTREDKPETREDKPETKKRKRTRSKTEYELYYEVETPKVMEQENCGRREARRIVAKQWKLLQDEKPKRGRGRPVGTTGASEYQIAIGAVAAHIFMINDGISKKEARKQARGYWTEYSGTETNVSEKAAGIIRCLTNINEGRV